jgi:hypothetical protein
MLLWCVGALAMDPATGGLPPGRLPPLDTAWFFRPHTLLAWAWLVALGVALFGRDPRGGAAVGRVAGVTLVVAAVARFVTFSPRTFMHFDKAPSHLLSARGNQGAGLYYGDGWAGLHGPLWRLLGQTGWGDVDPMHATNAAVSALGAAAVARAVALLLPALPTAGLFAGLAVALSPLSLALAPTESHFVPVATAQAAALAGLAGGRRRDAWLAVLSAGVLAHTRPLQVGVAAVVLAVLLWQRRGWPAAAGAAILAWRVDELGVAYHTLPAVGNGAQLHTLGFALEPLKQVQGEGVRWLPAEPSVSPWLWLPLGAVAGVWGVWRRERGVAVLLAAHVIAVLPYLHQPRWHDLLRFELPAVMWWAALGGVGLAVLASPWPPPFAAARAPVAALLLVGFGDASWRAREPVREAVWTAEHRFLLAVAPRLPAGLTVRYCDTADPSRAFYTWINTRSPATWLPLRGPTPPGAARFVGVADRSPRSDCPVPPGREVIAEALAAPDTRGIDDLGALGEAPVRFQILAPERP